MAETAEAVAYGAGTIINAIATGKGAAFGVDLWTKASVKLTGEAGVTVGRILSDPEEKPKLIEKCVKKVFSHFGVEEKYGAYVETDSNIPIARGLKSSSSAANAIVLATSAALGRSLNDLEAVKLGVEASIDANVTVTGAFDDACASYFGNVVVTDNGAMSIQKIFELKDKLKVLFHVPKRKVYTAEIDLEKVRRFTHLVEVAYNEALGGNYWLAMKLNGLIYSVALGYSPAIASDAISAGATSVGLSGKGPAVAAVVSEDKLDRVKETLEAYEGEIIACNLNRKKAHVVRVE